MRNLCARSMGALLLLASVGSMLLHRPILERAHYGSPRLAEFALGLLTVALASSGILLLTYGLSFVHAARSFGRGDRARFSRASEVRRLLAASEPEAVLLDSRRGVALILAYRALAAAGKRDCSLERLFGEAEAAYRRGIARHRR